MRLNDIVLVFRSRRMATLLALGFSAGLPLALTAGTLQAWMTVSGVNLKTMGLFALVATPYTVKFLWSPFMDRYALPWLGRRRGWILLTQAGLALATVAMSLTNPVADPMLMAALAFAVAFLSASQDIVIDAYRTDILHASERGAGAAVYVLGYRMAMIVSGALALVLGEQIGWPETYRLMALCLAVGMVAALLGPEPASTALPPRTLAEAVTGPLMNFFQRSHALSLILLVILYKLADAYAGSLTTAFLIRGAGFSPTEVGAVNKGFGLVATIVGAMVGGGLMARLGLFKALMIFGILQAVSNLGFMLLAMNGQSHALLFLAVGFENISSGMGTTAFMALLMALCDHRFSATQYALLSSLSSLGRIVIAPTAGYLVEGVGWPMFFFLTAWTALPGLVMIRWLRADITRVGNSEAPV